MLLKELKQSVSYPFGIAFGFGNRNPGDGSAGASPVTYTFVWWGQSELFYTIGGAFSNIGSAGTVNDESMLRVFFRNDFGGGPTEVLDEVVTNSNKVSRWAVEMSNFFAAVLPAGSRVNIIYLAESGTGHSQMVNDALAGRDWTDSQEVWDAASTALSITAPDGHLMLWQNADSTTYNARIGDAWWTFLTNSLFIDGSAITRGNTYFGTDFDNFGNDLFPTQADGATATPFGFINNRYDVLSGGAADDDRFLEPLQALNRIVNTSKNAALDVPLKTLMSPMHHTTGETGVDIAHPEQSDNGLKTFVLTVAYACLELIDVLPAHPRIDQVTWTSTTLTLGSSSGDLTTLRRIRGTPSLPSGHPKVASIFWSPADGSVERQEVPDAAISFSGGNIVISSSDVKSGGANYEAGDRFHLDYFGSLNADDHDVAYLDWPGVAYSTGGFEMRPIQPVYDRRLENTLSYTASGNITYADSLCPTDISGTEWQLNMTSGLEQTDGFYSHTGNTTLDTNIGADNFTAPSGTTSTFVVDIDKVEGRTSTNFNSASIRIRTFGTIANLVSGIVSDLWGTPTINAALADDSGVIILGKGQVRAWMHITHDSGSRLQAITNSNNNGGAYKNPAVFNGHLSLTEISRLGNPTT